MKNIIKEICPPIIWRMMLKLRKKHQSSQTIRRQDSPSKQDLELYWDPKMALILEEWGEENVWNEIQLLMASVKGKVLDIACGTGIVIRKINKFNDIDIYGCDISDVLIKSGYENNIPKEKLLVCDATKMPYQDKEFDYSYSIGSLEHFTEQGIDDFLSESSRITKYASYHMIPTSKKNQNEGWITPYQSYFNNSNEWWTLKYEKHFDRVYTVKSKWEDNISFGYWFICINNQ